jgi:hypothetical protein
MCIFRAFSALDRYLASQRTDRGYIYRTYLLGEYSEYDRLMTHVPEDCIYVEEWRKGDEVRRRVLYEFQEITPYLGNPFDPVKTPWTWIGDLSTEVDITLALSYYIMPGNEIRLDLLLLFLKSHNKMDIRYADASSDKDVVFPADGVRIDAV